MKIAVTDVGLSAFIKAWKIVTGQATIEVGPCRYCGYPELMAVDPHDGPEYYCPTCAHAEELSMLEAEAMEATGAR